MLRKKIFTILLIGTSLFSKVLGNSVEDLNNTTEVKKKIILPYYLIKLIEFEDTIRIINEKRQLLYYAEGFDLDFIKDDIDKNGSVLFFYEDEIIQDLVYIVEDVENISIEGTDSLKNIKARLIPFASYDISGSLGFAFWKWENKSIDDAPIIYIGETSMYVIASNMEEFIQLLSSGGIFCMLDGICNSVDKKLWEKYKIWVEKDLSLKLIQSDDEIKRIIKKSQDKYQKDFFNWLRKNNFARYANDIA